MSKYLAIAGHGSGDSGATGLISKGEHRFMKEDLFPEMRKYSKDIKYFSDYNVYMRGNLLALARRYGMNVIEFHFDNFDGRYSGGHVIIHSDYKPDSMDLRLVKAIDQMVGARLSFRGVKGLSGRSDLKNLNIARNRGISYRLLELGNSNNKSDVNQMVNNTNEYARKLVNAIENRSVSIPSKPSKSDPSLNEIVRRTKRGDFGNYPERKRRIENETPYSYREVQDIINRGTPVKPKSYNVGDRVKIRSNAKRYSTGERIPQYVKNRTHTIQQVKSDRVLLKEIYSWISLDDLA